MNAQGSIRGAHASRVFFLASRQKGFPEKWTQRIWFFNNFGETPKSARETQALPRLLTNHAPTSAFTLTELLVSMAILCALILLLFAVVDNTTRVWNQSEQRVDAFREARAALFIIARDLQTMVPAPDLVNEALLPANPSYSIPNGLGDFKYFFVNSPKGGATDVTFSSVAETTTGSTEIKYGDRLFFMTSQSPNAQTSGSKSDVCLVGYYLDYKDAAQGSAAGTPPAFKLFRYFKNSDLTFPALKNYSAGTSTVLMNANSGPTGDEVLARNVVDFRIQPYKADYTGADIHKVSPDTWDSKTTPYAVDISITAYNYSAANNFSNPDDWLNFTSAKNAPARQTFSTRVYLPRH